MFLYIAYLFVIKSIESIFNKLHKSVLRKIIYFKKKLIRDIKCNDRVSLIELSFYIDVDRHVDAYAQFPSSPVDIVHAGIERILRASVS